MASRPPVPPITNQFPIVDGGGRPTDYFIRWLQERGFEINGIMTPEQIVEIIQQWASERNVNTGTGLTGGGPLNADLTLALNAVLNDLNDVDTVTTPPINGNVLKFNGGTGLWVPGSGGGGGGNWWLQPPNSAIFTYAGWDANAPTLTNDSDVGLIVNWVVPVGGDRERGLFVTLTNKTLSWQLVVGIRRFAPAVNWTYGGVTLYDSIANRTESLSAQVFNSGFYAHTARTRAAFTGAGTDFASLAQQNFATGEEIWFRVTFDSAANTLSYEISPDGKRWKVLAAPRTSTTWLTNRADKVGWGIVYNQTSGPCIDNVFYWSLTGPGV